MNLIGKILTVLILLMSIAFMSFAIVVYATHKNWREAVERPRDQVGVGKELGLKYRIEDLRKMTDDLKAEREKLDAEVTAERNAKDELVKKLRAERDELQKERDALDAQVVKLKDDNVQANAAVKTAADTLTDLTGEVGKLRDEIRDAQGDRDKKFKEAVALTDQIQQAQGELVRQKERMQQLTAQNVQMRDVLNRHGLKAEEPVTPPQLAGEILTVNQDNLVELSLGEDDGLRRGHTLEVSRQSKYLGRVEVVRVTSDKAVAKILPNFKKGPIQRGDHVTTGNKSG